MGLHFRKKTAGKTFTAKCGHKIQKGETYIQDIEYYAYNRYYRTSCVPCWNGQSKIKIVNGEFVVTGKPTPLVMMKGA